MIQQTSSLECFTQIKLFSNVLGKGKAYHMYHIMRTASRGAELTQFVRNNYKYVTYTATIPEHHDD